MIKNTLATVFFVLLAVAPVMGQSAQDFFHSGARTYVDARLPEALNYVESGLELEPDNARLRALKEKIEEELENQQQQQGDNNEQSSEDQQNQQDNQEQNSDQEQQESDEEQESEQDQQSEEEQQQDGEPQEGEESEQEQQNSPDQQMPPDTDQLSKEQAERILQALENEEEKLLREVQKIKGRPRRVEKDW